MDIQLALLKEHSKKQSLRIAKYIGNNPERFDELVQLFTRDNYRVTQRAAWVLGIVGDKHPELFNIYISRFLELLEKTNLHDAVKRNILKVLRHVQMPDNQAGKWIDLCFLFARDPKQALAVRAYSIHALVEACLQWPDLKFEVESLLDGLKEHDAPAIQSTLRNGWKTLNKIK